MREKTIEAKLVPYVNNARTHSPEQINKLRSSLREFGFINPVIIDLSLIHICLGKSIITLSAIFDLCLDSFLVRKVLVIAPLRVGKLHPQSQWHPDLPQ